MLGNTYFYFCLISSFVFDNINVKIIHYYLQPEWFSYILMKSQFYPIIFLEQVDFKWYLNFPIFTLNYKSVSAKA